MHISLFLIPLLLLPATGFGQTVFFHADAESGTVKPPWQDTSGGGSMTTSTTQVHSGNRAYRYELPNPCNPSCVQSTTQALTIKKPQLDQAYYSYWRYIDAGVDQNNGNQFEFKADISSPGTGAGPKLSAFTHDRGRGRELILNIRNPQLSQAEWNSIGMGTKFKNLKDLGTVDLQRLSLVPVPFRSWHHIEMFLKASKKGGHIKVWQDGVLLFDVSHPNLNTLDCATCSQQVHDREYLHWGVGLYQHKATTVQRIYIDDAMITDYRVFPTTNNPPPTANSPIAPSNLTIVEK